MKKTYILLSLLTLSLASATLVQASDAAPLTPEEIARAREALSQMPGASEDNLEEFLTMAHDDPATARAYLHTALTCSTDFTVKYGALMACIHGKDINDEYTLDHKKNDLHTILMNMMTSITQQQLESFQSGHQFTLLHDAAVAADTALLEALVGLGILIDPTTKEYGGRTALQMAQYRHGPDSMHVTLVQQLAAAYAAAHADESAGAISGGASAAAE